MVLRKGKLYHGAASWRTSPVLNATKIFVTSSPVSTSVTEQAEDVTEGAVDARRTPVFLLAVMTFVLQWLANPPLELAPLAWLAPVPLMLLVFPKSLASPKVLGLSLIHI